MLWLGLVTTPQLSPLPDSIGDLHVSPHIVAGTAYAALLLFSGAMLAMTVFYFARAWARRAVAATVGRVSTRLSDWLSVRVEKVANGLSFLPRARNTLVFVGLTAVYWLVNAYATCWLADGVGMPELGLGQACVVTGVLALGVMVPNAPGFLGAFQFSVFAALSLYYPPADLFSRGASLVFFLFLGQTLVTLGGGVVGAVLLRTSLGELLSRSEGELDA
jgi:hypothetical protein